jgi:hypothetical protein
MGTFVFEGTEVRKTGREATREVGTGARSRKLLLVEITPVDTSFDWKKWVDPSMLFIVQPKEDT